MYNYLILCDTTTPVVTIPIAIISVASGSIQKSC